MKKTLLILIGIAYFLSIENVFSQTQHIQGKVVDGGEPLPGVSVKIKNTDRGISTNDAGEFSLDVPFDAVLLVSFLGYETQEVLVNNRKFVTIDLRATNNELMDVVIVGYGQQKRITTTGAISSVSGEDLVKAPVAGISNALIGMAPGLQAVQSSGEFGNDKATIFIRGMATLNAGGRGPLIMIDGVERETYNNLDPNEIESINILKDA